MTNEQMNTIQFTVVVDPMRGTPHVRLEGPRVAHAFVRFAARDTTHGSVFREASEGVMPFLACQGEAGLAPNDPNASLSDHLSTVVECWCSPLRAAQWVLFLQRQYPEWAQAWLARDW